MNKNILWSIMSLMAVALLTPCLTACSDDDDDKVNVNPAILGYWDLSTNHVTATTILFQKNGKGVVQTYNFQTNTYATERTFTFETEPETRMKAEIIARGKITYENGEVDDFEAYETGYLSISGHSGSYQKKTDIIGSWITIIRKYEFQKGGKGVLTINSLPAILGESEEEPEIVSITYKTKDERTGTFTEKDKTYYYVIVGIVMNVFKDAALKNFYFELEKRD